MLALSPTCSKCMLDSDRAALCHCFCSLLPCRSFLAAARGWRGLGHLCFSQMIMVVVLSVQELQRVLRQFVTVYSTFSPSSRSFLGMSRLEETLGKTSDMSPWLCQSQSSWKCAGKCPERGKSGCPCTDCCPCHLTHGRRGIDGQINWPLMDNRGAWI